MNKGKGASVEGLQTPSQGDLFSVLCHATGNLPWMGKHFSVLKSRARQTALALAEEKILPSS